MTATPEEVDDAEYRVEIVKEELDETVDDVFELGTRMQAFGRQLQDAVEHAEDVDQVDLEHLDALLDEAEGSLAREMQQVARSFNGQLFDLKRAEEEVEIVQGDVDE